MTSTLIVRDATLAVNGAPEKRGDPHKYLAARVAEVARMESRTLEECVEVLSSVASGEGADPEVLQALVVIALAQPRLAERLGVSAVATGRRLASKLEREASVDSAVALLELLQKHHGGQDAIEHDLSQLMRRQGMVQDLTGRYYERARKLIREGRTNEAAGWLREVLQLDPSRKDAARLMRDLRFKRAGGTQRRRFGFGFVLTAALLSLALSYATLREFRLQQEFATLPGVVKGNPASMRRRLAELEQFMGRAPIWHGALGALKERSELRVELGVLADQERREQEQVERLERERLESAELLRQRALMRVQSGNLRDALADFRQALEAGGPEWVHRERVARDVSDLEAHLSRQP